MNSIKDFYQGLVSKISYLYMCKLKKGRFAKYIYLIERNKIISYVFLGIILFALMVFLNFFFSTREFAGTVDLLCNSSLRFICIVLILATVKMCFLTKIKKSVWYKMIFKSSLLISFVIYIALVVLMVWNLGGVEVGKEFIHISIVSISSEGVLLMTKVLALHGVVFLLFYFIKYMIEFIKDVIEMLK